MFSAWTSSSAGGATEDNADQQLKRKVVRGETLERLDDLRCAIDTKAVETHENKTGSLQSKLPLAFKPLTSSGSPLIRTNSSAFSLLLSAAVSL